MGDTLILAGMTERAANAAPAHAALIQGDDHLDYAALHDAVLRCVAALRAQGIGKGDRIGYLGLNSIDHIVLLQASFRIGAVTVAVNWRLVAREVAYILKDAGVVLLVTDTERLPLVEDTSLVAVLTDAPHAGRPAFRQWIAAVDPDPTIAELTSEDIALELYTSGTTGFPKGALLTYGGVSAATGQGQRLGEPWAVWSVADVSLLVMPQFHIGGAAWILQTLNARATAVILAKPEIDDIIDAIERHGVTKMFVVPAVLGMILDHPRAAGADFGSLRVVIYGASPIPLDLLKRSMALFPNAAFIQMYGATETSGAIVYLPPEDHDVAGTPRMAGCGKPFPETALRIVDGAGADLPIGKVGEVLVKSAVVMGGYHNLPDATEDAFDGEWYRSGDAGYLDSDGYLYLVDRVKDMIVSGAENIYPAEVETVLHDHPGVRDCAVIGVPDARWGEAVKAFVVATPGMALDAESLIAFARTRIAGYKVPKSIDFVDELPRNASGKILKRELRKHYWDAAGRQVG